jgi:alpha-tubulin suppressor-like RCC1 family protein
LGLDFRGKLWGWGYNNRGQLAAYSDKYTPINVIGINKTFCQISGGYGHSLGIDLRGKTWSWGYNNRGQLGDNTIFDRYTPIAVSGTTKTFCQISAGFYHSLGLDLRGKAWGWGANNYGQLGDNTVLDQCTRIAVLGTNKTFCQISAGNHSLGLDFRGKLWSWGYNYYGQLGDNSTFNKSTPFAILGTNKTFCQISASSNTSLGIDLRGKLWGWGYNNHGQLGDNSTARKYTPVAILGINKTFCQIFASSYNSSGLDCHGKLWCWGYNYSGQLGDNTIIDKYTPVAVYGNKTFCQISGGYSYSLGLDFRGKVWSWGTNVNGQLGDNTIINKCTPVAVYGNKTFCQIYGSHNYTSFGVDFSGKLWGWGNNNYGQLGNGESYITMTPKLINI